MTRPILYISGPYSAGNGRTTASGTGESLRLIFAGALATWLGLNVQSDVLRLKVVLIMSDGLYGTRERLHE